jgi:hypothetical protein
LRTLIGSAGGGAAGFGAGRRAHECGASARLRGRHGEFQRRVQRHRPRLLSGPSAGSRGGAGWERRHLVDRAAGVGGPLVRASCADRAAGERMLADVRSGLERLRAIDGPQGFLLRTTPENIRPGRREAGRGSRARRRRPAEPGGGGQETCVDLNAQPSPSPSPSPPPTTTPTPTPTPPSSAPPAAASAAAPLLSGVLGRVIEATVTIVGRASLTYGSPSSSLGSLWSAASITASTPCCYSLDKRRGFNDRGELVRASRPPGAENAGLPSIESRDR